MGTQAQRGNTLVESAVAVGIVATLAGAALSSTIFSSRSAGNATIRDALQQQVENEMRVALDVLKYRGTTLAPATIATSVPMPAGTPLPVRLSLVTAPLANGGTAVTVTATSIADPAQRATLSGSLDSRAPLPGSSVRAAGLAPAPTGAP